MDTLEQLINNSLLLLKKGKIEKKYKDDTEITSLYDEAVNCLWEKDEEGNPNPDIQHAINCISKAACHGMKEAKQIMRNLSNIAKHDLESFIIKDDVFDYLADEVNKLEEEIKLQIDETIETAIQQGKKSIRKFNFTAFGQNHELELQYPNPRKLIDKDLRAFLLAGALSETASQLLEKADKCIDKEEFALTIAMLDRSLNICLQSEKEWTLDLISFNLLYEAELCDKMGEISMSEETLFYLFQFLLETYYAKRLEYPYDHDWYMTMDEGADNDQKLDMLMWVLKNLYVLTLHNDIQDAEEKKEKLSILSRGLGFIILDGLNSYDGGWAYFLIYSIWDKWKEDASLYSLLMYENPIETLTDMLSLLYQRIITFENSEDQNYDWMYGFLYKHLQIEKFSPELDDAKDEEFWLAFSALFVVCSARCKKESVEEQLNELQEWANEEDCPTEFYEAFAFAHFVYYTNQGNHELAYTGALSILEKGDVKESNVAAGIEKRRICLDNKTGALEHV